MDEKFQIAGYDKDNDVYETLCTADNLSWAEKIAAAILDYHGHTEELRRSDGDHEPFDWFVIRNMDDVICRTYTI